MRTLVCLLTTAVILSACGKKGPLIYPDMLVPAAPADVAVQQRGEAMKLSFVLPSKDMAGRNLTDLASVKILKREEMIGQTPACSSCAADFVLFRTVNLEPLPPGVQRYGSLVLLLDGDVQAGRKYSYRITAFTKGNQEGTAATAAASVLLPAPAAPVLKATSQPTEVQLEFTGPPPLEGVVAGYNLYRSTRGEPLPLLPLNKSPLSGNGYVDQGLQRSVTYVYAARSLVRLASGVVVESGPSNETEAALKDDE
jgi:predicted small lipoprotein YifL